MARGDGTVMLWIPLDPLPAAETADSLVEQLTEAMCQPIERPGERADGFAFQPSPERVERYEREMEAAREAERVESEDLMIWIV